MCGEEARSLVNGAMRYWSLFLRRVISLIVIIGEAFVCWIYVIGKVVARILQERLQKLGMEELPESHCGFRKGRSCADIIFVVRQSIEKSWEHKSKAFFTFIDLKKAYDSVPREAMWLALGKLGVPELLVKLIKSFHEDIKAKIRLDGVRD